MEILMGRIVFAKLIYTLIKLLIKKKNSYAINI